MPTYLFKNKETGELSEHIMSCAKLDEFKTNNPLLERHITADNLPIMSDATRLSVPGLKKADSGFEKYVINRMKNTIPGNTMGGHKSSGSNISEF